MTDCIFCRIVNGEIPSKKAYEDELVVAFHDINPQAPVHIVIIPKHHVGSALELSGADDAALCAMFGAARQVAHDLGVAQDGFRLIINTGKNAGQTVAHLHLHLLAGRQFTESLV